MHCLIDTCAAANNKDDFTSRTAPQGARRGRNGTTDRRFAPRAGWAGGAGPPRTGAHLERVRCAAQVRHVHASVHNILSARALSATDAGPGSVLVSKTLQLLECVHFAWHGHTQHVRRCCDAIDVTYADRLTSDLPVRRPSGGRPVSACRARGSKVCPSLRRILFAHSSLAHRRHCRPSRAASPSCCVRQCHVIEL